jgi:uncharacterized protein YbjT (DUF2867 family)
MTRTLLLVGGTGKIGSALVELLRPAAIANMRIDPRVLRGSARRTDPGMR